MGVATMGTGGTDSKALTHSPRWALENLMFASCADRDLDMRVCVLFRGAFVVRLVNDAVLLGLTCGRTPFILSA